MIDSFGTELGEAVSATSNLVQLMVPNALLKAGENRLTINIQYPGCSVSEASEEVVVNVSEISQPTVSKELITGCEANTISLKASGAKSGQYYEWFDVWNEVILDNATATLLIQTLDDEWGQYEVRIVSASGCKSIPSARIDVDSDSLMIDPLSLDETVDYAAVICAGQDFEILINEVQVDAEYALSDTKNNTIGGWISADSTTLTMSVNSETIETVDNLNILIRRKGCSSKGMVLSAVIKPTVNAIPELTFTNNVLAVLGNPEGKISWYLNNEFISNESSLAPTKAGVYYAQVVFDNCMLQSNFFDYLITGNKSGFSHADIAIFPNPVDNFSFTVKGSFETSADVELKIYDAFGRKIYSNAFSSFNLATGVKIDLSGMNHQAGIYIATLRQGNDIVKRKIVMK